MQTQQSPAPVEPGRAAMTPGWLSWPVSPSLFPATTPHVFLLDDTRHLGVPWRAELCLHLGPWSLRKLAFGARLILYCSD